MQDHSVNLEEQNLALWHLLGSGARTALNTARLPVPENDLHACFVRDGFVIRAGAREFLLATAQALPLPLPGSTWILRRHDRLLALRGPGWRCVTRWVCHFDFRGLLPGRWVQAAMGGIDVWTLLLDEQCLLIGCDPSHGEYLAGLLRQIIRDHAIPVSSH